MFDKNKNTVIGTCCMVLLSCLVVTEAYKVGLIGDYRGSVDSESHENVPLAANMNGLKNMPVVKKREHFQRISVSELVSVKDVESEMLRAAQESMISTGAPKIVSLRKSPVENVYEAYSDDGVYYITSDFKYSLKGDLVRNKDGVNLTALSSTVNKLEKEITEKANEKYDWSNSRTSGANENLIKSLPDETKGTNEFKGNQLNESALSLLNDSKSNLTGNSSANATPIKDSGAYNYKSRLDPQYVEDYKNKIRKRLESRMSKTSLPGSSSHDSKNTNRKTGKESLNLSQIQKGSGFVEYKNSVVHKVGFSKTGKPLSLENTKKQISDLYKKVEKYGDKWSVVYPAKGVEKGGVVVFSDPTCGVCKRLHRNIEEMNEKGLTVRVLMYPRALAYGPKDKDASRVLETLESIWCSVDPAKTMHDVYSGKRVNESDCSIVKEQGRTNFPVSEHYFLGLVFGIKGTPLSFSNEGVLISGFGSSESFLGRVGIK